MLSKELGVLLVRETSRPPGVYHTTTRCCCCSARTLLGWTEGCKHPGVPVHYLHLPHTVSYSVDDMRPAVLLSRHLQSTCLRGRVGQLGMAHRSDGPASSLRMFGHVHRAMCGGGCQFEVLEEHVGARRGVGGTSESVGGRRRSLEDVGCRWRMSVRGDIAGPRPEYRSLTGPGYRP